MLTPDQKRFLELDARHKVAVAVFTYEQDTNNVVKQIVLQRVPGRRDALVKFVIEEKSDEN